MQIQSTLQTAKRPSTPLPTPSRTETKESLFSRDEVQLGASAFTGGLALGAGGGWLGAKLGVAYAANHILSSPLTASNDPTGGVATAVTVVAALPVMALYGGIGGLIGATAGGVAGSALGYGLCQSYQENRAS